MTEKFDSTEAVPAEKQCDHLVSESAYIAAVQGRRDFRNAFREVCKERDRFGLVLQMIEQGHPDPAGFAREQLLKAKVRRQGDRTVLTP